MTSRPPSGGSSASLAPAASKAIEFDDSRFPISVYTFVSEVAAADMEIMLQHSEGLLRRGKHAIIMDLRHMAAMGPKQRQRAAEWNAANAQRLALRRAGLAMVITDPHTRGIITAIYWQQPPPYPHLICTTLTEALDWCRERLAE